MEFVCELGVDCGSEMGVGIVSQVLSCDCFGCVMRIKCRGILSEVGN